jgi:2,3-bisphosphoglycerate-dependent phosphoglycerate mutase
VTTIDLVRHAHAVWTPDEARPLSPAGRQAADALADVLGSAPIAAIYSSPSQRAVETVAPLAKRIGLPIARVADLRERDLPGVPVADFEGLVRDLWSHPDEAPAWGESNAAARARGLAAVRGLLARHEGQHLVAATHGNLLALVVNGLDPAYGFDFWRGLSFPDAYRLSFDEDEVVRIERVWGG